MCNITRRVVQHNASRGQTWRVSCWCRKAGVTSRTGAKENNYYAHFIQSCWDFSFFLFLFSFFYRIFALAFACRAAMSSMDDGADGQCTTYWKALRRFVFGYSKLPQSNWGQKQCRGNSTGCSIYSPSVREAQVASPHTLRMYYILQTWVFLWLFSSKAVVGLEQRTGRCKHPRSFVCSC